MSTNRRILSGSRHITFKMFPKQLSLFARHTVSLELSSFRSVFPRTNNLSQIAKFCTSLVDVEVKKEEPKVKAKKRPIYGFAAIKLALTKFKEKYGDCLVPVIFEIPTDCESWPLEVRGMKLGKVSNNIRSGASYVQYRAELIEIGFDFSSQSTAYGFPAVKTALLYYKSVHGDMLIPMAFTVPFQCDKWPEETWGMKLGLVVISIRRKDSYKEHFPELQTMGFDYKCQRIMYGYPLVKTALLAYKDLHSNLLVPRHFVIPQSSDQWPEITWGVNLGPAVSSIRRGNSYKYMHEELKAMGFSFDNQKGNNGDDKLITTLS